MIDPKKKYSLLELVKLKAFPGLNSFTAYRTAVMRDRLSGNVLKAEVLGEGRATRIYIKGANVLEYQQVRK